MANGHSGGCHRTGFGGGEQRRKPARHSCFVLLWSTAGRDEEGAREQKTLGYRRYGKQSSQAEVCGGESREGAAIDATQISFTGSAGRVKTRRDETRRARSRRVAREVGGEEKTVEGELLKAKERRKLRLKIEEGAVSGRIL